MMLRLLLLGLSTMLLASCDGTDVAVEQSNKKTVPKKENAEEVKEQLLALVGPLGEVNLSEHGTWRVTCTEGHIQSLHEIGPLLKELRDVTSLDLAGNPISDISCLAHLARLSHLYLSRTRVSDLTPLSELTQLQTLYLYDTQVSELLPLSGLTRLEVLDLYETNVSDVTPLAKLTQLRSLDLSRTQVTDLTPLSELVQLEGLEFDDTQVSDLAPLASLTQLQTLWLSSLASVGARRKVSRLCNAGTHSGCRFSSDMRTTAHYLSRNKSVSFADFPRCWLARNNNA